MLRFAISSALLHFFSVFSETLHENLPMAIANQKRKPHRVRRRQISPTGPPCRLARKYRIVPTNSPWVSEDVRNYTWCIFKGLKIPYFSRQKGFRKPL